MRKPPFCHYCRRLLMPSTAKSELRMTRDHVTPKSLGGSVTVPCCFKCNSLKDNLTALAWRRFTLAFPQWWRTFNTSVEVRAALRSLPGDTG